MIQTLQIKNGTPARIRRKVLSLLKAFIVVVLNIWDDSANFQYKGCNWNYSEAKHSKFVGHLNIQKHSELIVKRINRLKHYFIFFTSTI